jgi:hypothetical protein
MPLTVRRLALICSILVATPAWGDDVKLAPTGPSTLGQIVDVVLEIRGNMTADFDGETATNVPMEVDGRLTYRERQLRSQRSVRHLREYQKANAQIDYGRDQIETKLEPANRWIIVDRRVDPEQPKRVRYLTSGGGLSQGELDLLTLPASTLVWDRLLEAASVQIAKPWEPASDLLADVLAIDAIERSSVRLEVTGVRSGIATIAIAGQAAGLIDDAETEFDVRGTCQFDLTAGYTRQLQLTLKENRTICESAPGYDAVIKLEMRVNRPSDDVLPQSEIESAGLDQRKWSDAMRLVGRSRDFQLRHDRRWRLVQNDNDLTLLRYVDGDVLLGQCTVKRLSKLASPTGYTIENFRQEVAKNTADRGQITTQDAFTTAQGLQVMQLDVQGKADSVALIWRYFHVVQEDGQRLLFVVTFDSEIASRFDGVDRRLVESASFLPIGTAPRTTNASVEKPAK